MNIFNHNSYRAVIKEFIKNNKNIRGYHSNLAKAAGCSKSYLSQTLNSHIQLTADHAYGIASLWQLNEDETEYFLALIQYERASSLQLKKYYEKKMNKLKNKNQNLKRIIKSTENISNDLQMNYYSSWLYPSLHVLVSIPEFQTEQNISREMKLPIDHIHKLLIDLEQMGYIKKVDGKWLMTNKSIHAPEESLVCKFNHINWRQKTIINIQEKNDGGIHYTGVHSVSKKDYEIIKNMLVEAIQNIRNIITPSPEEELVCLLCDFYPILKP